MNTVNNLHAISKGLVVGKSFPFEDLKIKLKNGNESIALRKYCSICK